MYGLPGNLLINNIHFYFIIIIIIIVYFCKHYIINFICPHTHLWSVVAPAREPHYSISALRQVHREPYVDKMTAVLLLLQ